MPRETSTAAALPRTTWSLGRRLPIGSLRSHGAREIVGVAALGAFVVIALLCLLAPVVAPYSPTAIDLTARFQGPSLSASHGFPHIAGTDELGRDIFSRLLYGGRISLLVSGASVLAASVVGVVLGLLAGYLGGIADIVIMRFADIQLGIPTILLAVVVIAARGTSLVSLVIVMAVAGWVDYARVVRSRVLSVRELDYVTAARILGVGAFQRLRRHILPNVASSVIVIANLQVATMILLEAALSFLGLGVQPPTPSWGNIAAEGRIYLGSAWWVATMPGVAIVLVVVSITLFGDWMRDRFDPKAE